MTVDLSEVSKQVQGFYNSGITAGRSCCQVAFKCLTSPLDLPINEGQFRALDIVLPPGRVVSAVKPAAMRMWMTYPMTVVDTIFKALAPALPDQVIAGHHADLVRRPHQRPPAEGRQLLHLSRRPDRRRLGRQVQQRRHERDHRDERRRHPQRPVRAGRGEVSAAGRALLPAAGFRRRRALPRRPRHRAGGAGAPPDPLLARRWIACKCKPWGLFGGMSGFGNAVAMHRFGKTEETHFPNGKALNQVLQPGDAYILRSGGGGGYGSPLERDLADAGARRALRLRHQGRGGEILRRGVPARFAGARPRGDRGPPRHHAAAGPAARRADRRGDHPFPAAPQPQAPSPGDEKLTEEERVAFAMRCRCCS